MSSLRLVFMGTPDFAVPPLRALHAAGCVIAGVYCQPPKPAGRGQHIQKTPVHLCAEQLGLPVFTPRRLRDPSDQAQLADLRPDIIVVAAYGLILPRAVLDIPRHGCINIHASLLLRWRGAAPIHRALLANDAQTGITIMQMEEGLDTGPVLMKRAIDITPDMTAQALHDVLSDLGAQMIGPALDGWIEGSITPIPQPEDGVTYAAKLTRADGIMDWRKPATDLARQIRALHPWPGAFFTCDGASIKVIRATAIPAPPGALVPTPPGTLLDAQMTIACGTGALRLDMIQKPGKTPVDGAAFLRGARLALGTCLPVPADSAS